MDSSGSEESFESQTLTPSGSELFGELASSQGPIQEVPIVKPRVPSAPFLEKSHLVEVLTPYHELIDQIQAIMLFRRPIHALVLLCFIELMFFILGKLKAGFLLVMIIITSFTIMGATFWIHNKNWIIKYIFPPIEDRGNENESNRIYSLDEIASFCSIIGSRLHIFITTCIMKATDETLIGATLWTLFLFCCFIAATIIPTYYVLFLLVNFIVLAPGFLLHPNVYIYAKPYLERVLAIITPKMREE